MSCALSGVSAQSRDMLLNDVRAPTMALLAVRPAGLQRALVLSCRTAGCQSDRAVSHGHQQFGTSAE